MAHNTETEEHSTRIVRWLLEHRSEFEQNGIEESTLPNTVGLSETEVTKAIDHLESHEDVARLPEEISNPPRFLIRPARGWPEIVNSESKKTGVNA